MCFSDQLGDKQIQDIEAVERKVLFNCALFNSLNLWGRLGKILFKKKTLEEVAIVSQGSGGCIDSPHQSQMTAKARNARKTRAIRGLCLVVC